MVIWPVYTLASEGLLLIAIGASLLSGVTVYVLIGEKLIEGLNAFFYARLAGFTAFVLSGLVLTAKYWIEQYFPTIPWLETRPGKCTKEQHVARVQDLLALSRKGAISEATGMMHMHKEGMFNRCFWPTPQATMKGRKIDLSAFAHVIESVHAKNLWVDVEACATFENVVATLLPEGYIPAVVPPFRTMTVGGAVVGFGVGSSSFRYGYFHDSVLEADVLLANGKIVTAEPTGEHAELFHALPNSLGSLGFLVRLRIKVQPAKPAVKIDKVRYSSTKAFLDGLNNTVTHGFAGKQVEFIDAVGIGNKNGVMITAEFANELPIATATGGLRVWTPGDKPLYQNLGEERTVYMKAEDYLFAWDSDWFWCSKTLPTMDFMFLRKFLIGRTYLRAEILQKFHHQLVKNVLAPLGLHGGISKDEELVCVDVAVPFQKAAEWLDMYPKICPGKEMGKFQMKYGKDMGISVPIWVCPVKGTGAALLPMEKGSTYLNCSFWDVLKGKATVGGNIAGNVNKAIEKACLDLHCKKMLCSACYFSEEEFDMQYGGERYKAAKKRYDDKGVFLGRFERVLRWK